MKLNLIFCFILLITNFKIIAQDLSNIELMVCDGDNNYSKKLENDYLVVRKSDSFNEFKIEKLKLKNIVFNHDSIGEIPEINNVVFMISGLSLPEKVRGLDCANEILFPGQTLRFDYNNTYLQLYGKGTPISNKDTTELMPYSMIKDYELRIRFKINGKIVDQGIYKQDIFKWMDYYYVGGPYLIWIGDLNNDNYIDLVYQTSEHHEEYSIHLLMSSKDSNGLLKEVAVSSYGY